MDNTQIVDFLLNECGKSVEDTLHSRTKVTFSELFLYLIQEESLKDTANKIDLTYDSFKSLISLRLKPLFPEKLVKSNWRTYLLSLVGLKICAICCERLDILDFGKHSSYCKDCANTYNSIYKKEHPLIDRNYYLQNKQDFIDRKAKRRAQKLNATVSWADLRKIREIYRNCPEGYHVDHIIPLQGTLVCGLHVENNLQYLTSFENKSKGNRFISP